ncbi:MAG: hypothetical protein ABEH81_13680 [Halopenitus sp.]
MQQSPFASGRSHLLLEPDEPTSGLQQTGGNSGDLIAVLYGQSADEWQRRGPNEAAPNPRREVLIDVVDVARGAAAAGSPATQVIPGRDIALRTMERPVDPDDVIESICSYLDTETADEATIYVDDLGGLVEDVGADQAVETIESVTDRIRTVGARGIFALDPETVPSEIVDRLRAAVDKTHGDENTDPDRDAIERLREEEPTNFGYARGHWREARAGLEHCSRNYPQARQIHEAIDDPATTPRTLGAALKALVTLGVLDTWSENVASTRYDLTAYDPKRMEKVGAALDAADD